MTIALTGTGGIFTRLGKIIGEYNRVCTAFGSSLNTGVSGIAAQFLSANQIVTDGLYTQRDGYRVPHGTYLSYLQTIAQNTVIEQVNSDVTLVSRTLANALTELRRQMLVSGDSLNRPTLGSTVTTGSSNAGNTTLFASTTSNLGVPTDQQLPETVTVTCQNDVSNGGTQYGEVLSFSGQPVRGASDYQWPGGSACSGTFNVTDGNTTTKLTDGNFGSWTGTGSNTPVNWTLGGSAVAGTHILRNSVPVRGTYACRFVSDGTVLVSIKQAVTLLPLKVYSLNGFGKISSTDATGAVRFRLTDGSGTTLADDASTDNTLSKNVNGEIGATYSQVQTFWRTPRQLPSQVFFEIAFTTSPTAARTVDFSLFSLVEAQQLYAGGPYVAAFSKDDATTVGDVFQIAVTNSLGTTAFIPSLDRLLSTRQLGIALPSAASETVSDSLIS